MSLAVVLEQCISAANGRDEETLVAIVVNIGEGGCHADTAGQCDACFLRDVLKLTAAEAFPEFISANLIHKVEVVQAIAVDIRNRDSAAVIIVSFILSEN